MEWIKIRIEKKMCCENVKKKSTRFIVIVVVEVGHNGGKMDGVK